MKFSRRAAAPLVTAAIAAAMLIPSSAAASIHDPVLFVHGWSGSASNWNTMKNRFAAAGWSTSELNTIGYNGSTSNAKIAESISTKVSQILAANPGKTKVDLISHSMGGLSTRYYVKNLGGGAKVDDFVSLAGPNHGTTAANACAFFSVQCREMQIGSTFLNTLNSGDETPGSPNFGTWLSPADGTINPYTSTILSGAANTELPGVSHLGFLSNTTVDAQVRAFVW